MTTPLDALVAALRDAATYNASAEASPEAVVWCDGNSEFAPLLPALRERLPELLTYGDFNLSVRSGPAVWLRAAAVGAIDAVRWPDGVTPILYLPGIGRETLKGAEDCPAPLQTLVWFTVAGSLFGHVNGKDWTLRGFLAAERGALKLSVADDANTRTALAHAALRFCTRPVEELRGKRWDADQLNALLAPDLAADMLDWIDGVFAEGADAGRFAAFAALDPGSLFDHSENRGSYPKLNLHAETSLRDALMKLEERPVADARHELLALEKEHAWRLQTVWAKRGEAPLAAALAHLARVARAKPLPSHDGAALAEAYVLEGAAIDQEAMSALAAAPREVDREAVTAALRALYLPWLEQNAVALQELVRGGKVKLPGTDTDKKPEANTILFVDGLRMDLAAALVKVLAAEGVTAKLNWCWSGFPTVTATCKPMVSPVAGKLSGPATTADVLPVAPDGKPATKPVLFKLMQADGWGTENELLPDGKLWAETGRFDEEGHALGARLADRLTGGVRDAADRVLQLVRMGRSVRIVTDHGWLLMPGGLPHAALDISLVEFNGKRTRCAMVKPKAKTSYLQVPWSWNAEVSIAAATGARSFYAGYEYAHGGISPQECILPVIEIEAAVRSRGQVSIRELKWEGLRLRVEVAGGADLRVDLKLGMETSGASLLKGERVLDENGRTSILVSDEHERYAACLVVIDDKDHIVAHRALTIGGD